MDYEQFKENFMKDVKDELAERGIGNVSISTQEVQKVNESYDAMTVTPEGGNIGVNLNLANFYQADKDDIEYGDIVTKAADTIEKAFGQAPTIDVASLTDYEQMKDKLVMEVVSTESNAEVLANVPHKEMEDMSVVYRMLVDEGPSSDDGRATVLVTNNLLDQFGVTAEQLYTDAMENAPELKPAVIQGMSEIMMEMMGREQAMEMGIPEMDPADEMMFVASTPDRIHGAGVIAYQEFMDQAAEKLGGDFFILPSSIHEILLVRDDGETNADTLRDMVQEVNETQVSPEEKLTDNVYHYDSKEHVFELAEKFEARQTNLEESTDRENEKDSLLDDLKSKKEEVAKQPKKDAVEKATEKNKGGEAI